MKIQESTNIMASDIMEINVEKFEASSSLNKPSAEIILEDSPIMDNFSLTECSFVKHETVLSKNEEDDTFNGLTDSEPNVKQIIDEHFEEFEFVVPEKVYIKSEVQDEDQFSTNNGTEILDEHLDELKFIVPEGVYIKNEVPEEDQLNTTYEENTTDTKKGERKYYCDKCNFGTRWKSNLVYHIRIHNRKYSCKQCPYHTTDKSSLKTHLRTHNSFRVICILCEKSFKQKVELAAHYVSRHPDRSDEWESTITNNINKCPKCPYKTVRTGDFKSHLATHGIPPGQFLVKIKTRESKCIDKSNRVPRSEMKYFCDKCNFETRRKTYLVSHIRKHEKQEYSCHQCPYQTIDKSSLKTHLRTHNRFGLICVLCKKFFKQKVGLDAHYVSRHPDRSDKWGSTITNKINKCPICLYKTVRTGDFKSHLATHGPPADEARFSCNTCGYKCMNKSNFDSHSRLHASHLPFVCTECDKRFSKKVHLDSHIISRHSANEELISSVTSKLHQCEKCNFKSVNRNHIKRHLKSCS